MLKLYDTLAGVLRAERIPFAVWKSLENLKDALAGKDDLDLLFLLEDRERVIQTLEREGLRADYDSPGSLGGELLVLWGVDPETLSVCMVHAHFTCRFGSKAYKEYRYPGESRLLDRVEIRQGIECLDPAGELITRFLQASVKGSVDDAYALSLVKHFESLSDEALGFVRSELAPFVNGTPDTALSRVAEAGGIGFKQAQSEVPRLLDQAESCEAFKEQIERLKPKQSFLRKLGSLRWRRNKIGNAPDVCLAGHDGCGKSSTVSEIAQVMEKLGTVKTVYLGRNRWSWLNSLINRHRLKDGRAWLNYLWPVTSSLEILVRLGMGKVYKALGWFVLYDRSLIDLALKYRGKPLRYAWFPLLVSKIASPVEAKHRYLLIADPEVASKRCGNIEASVLEKAGQAYSKEAGDRFVRLGTTSRSVQAVTSAIIRTVYFSG